MYDFEFSLYMDVYYRCSIYLPPRNIGSSAYSIIPDRTYLLNIQFDFYNNGYKSIK